MTWREVSDSLGIHHGKSSEALSTLHKNEAVTRLAQKRGGSGIYVTVANINGRPVKQRRYNNLPDEDVMTSLIETWVDQGASDPRQLARWIAQAA